MWLTTAASCHVKRDIRGQLIVSELHPDAEDSQSSGDELFQPGVTGSPGREQCGE
jgi:hypothetical protein